MEDVYVLQNEPQRTAQQANRREEVIPETIFISGINVFDDQTAEGMLVALQHEAIDPRTVARYKLHTGDRLTVDGDAILAINGIPVKDFIRYPARFIYPDRRWQIFDQNPGLAQLNLKAPVGRGQRLMVVSEPGKGKSTIGWGISTDSCRHTLENKLCKFYYVGVGERREDFEEALDIIGSTPHAKGQVVTVEASKGTKASAQWYKTWFALEQAEAEALSGYDVIVIIDCVSRVLGAHSYAPEIPKPSKSEGMIKQGLKTFSLIELERLLLAKGGQVRGGVGSLTIIFIMLLGDDSAESVLWFQSGLSVETATWYVRDLGAIDILKTRTRKVERMLHPGDPFTRIYQRMELIRKASRVEEVSTREGGKRQQFFKPSLEEQANRHELMTELVIKSKSYDEAFVALAKLAKEWNLGLELSN